MSSAVASAIAEIAIIVIGVLLALAADRWKQGRADRRLEREYLNGLATDLRRDREGLTAYLDQIQRALEAAETILDVVRSKQEPDPSTFARDLIRTADGNEPIYFLATYTELSVGGSI